MECDVKPFSKTWKLVERDEPTARHVAETDDPVDALRADVGDDSLQREIVSVDVGNRGEAHAGFIPAACR